MRILAFFLVLTTSGHIHAANAPACGQITKTVEGVLASASQGSGTPAKPGGTLASPATPVAPVGRYGDMPPSEKTAYLDKARKMSQTEAYSYSGTPVQVRAELLKDKPDWDSARNKTKSILSQGIDKFHRAATATEKISFLKRIEEDAGLLGIQSRNSPVMMKKAKEIYIHALKERMRRESVKDPAGAVEWLKKIAAEKKSSTRVGVDGEIDRWSADAIEEALQANQSNPKEWIIDQFKSYKAFVGSELDEAVKAGKVETDQANGMGRMITEEPNAPYRQAASQTPTPAVEVKVDPVGQLSRKNSEFEVGYKRRIKDANDFFSWSGGKPLTDQQSEFLSYRLRNISNYESNIHVIDELRKLGFNDVEIRMMQLNKYEFGPNKSFTMPKPSSEHTEHARKLLSADRVKMMEAPSDLNPTQAKNILADAFRLKPIEVDKMRDEFFWRMDELIQSQFKYTEAIMQAKTKDEALKAAEVRKSLAAVCRKIYQTFVSAQIPTNSDYLKRYKEATTTGNCRY
jgi:hypothetical protein